MKKRKVSFALTLIVMITMSLHSQVALKTNVLMDALRLPNIGAEVGLNKKLTIDASVYYNPWKFSDRKQFKLLMAQPELRYWLCDKFNGHFFGTHLLGGVYNIMGIKPLFALWDDMKEYRYRGHFWGGGFSYGYQFILGKHWNAEATVGFGYAYVTYRKYPCTTCGELIEKSHKNYWGPTKAGLSLIYLF